MSKKKQKKHTQKNVKERDIPMQENDEQKQESQEVKETVMFGDKDRALGSSTALQNQYDKMEVRNSPLEGYGVFATKDIKGGSVLEEIPFIVWNRSIDLSDKIMAVVQGTGFLSENEIRNDQIRNMFGHKHPMKYYFKWFPPNTPRDGDNPLFFQCLPLGFGPIYNSSNGRNNASWEVKEKTFTFNAVRDIAAGEEIQTFYGYFCAEDDATFNSPEVFGLAMEYIVNEDGKKEVVLTNVRFQSPKEQELRLKEQGCQELINSLRESQGRIKLNKISVIDNDKETHSFDFPEEFPLNFTFRKLQEFKQTRFPLVKLYISYQNLENNKQVKKEIIYANHNVLSG
jgi:hypothetical protein